MACELPAVPTELATTLETATYMCVTIDSPSGKPGTVPTCLCVLIRITPVGAAA